VHKNLDNPSVTSGIREKN